jgi:hypothetical protein
MGFDVAVGSIFGGIKGESGERKVEMVLAQQPL